MIIALSSITLSHMRDVESVTRYYKLQASTASVPAKPTTETPSGWTTTEPSYTEGSTNSLYIVDKTTLSDGTFSYSAVSLSSSYEAAKAAYNKSVTAQQTAQAAQESIDNLEVGGRNLLRNTEKITEDEVVLSRASIPEPGLIRITPSSSAGYCKFCVDYLDYADFEGSTLTVSLNVRIADVESTYTTENNLVIYTGVSIASRINSIFGSGYDRYTSKTITGLTSQWQRVSFTFAVPDSFKTGQASALIAGSQVTVQVAEAGSRSPIEVRLVKLERGNHATDWTPAPEDVQAGINTVQNNLDQMEVGGRNYLRVGPKSYTPGDYGAYDLVFTEPLEAGRAYTIQLWDVDVAHSAKTEEQLGIDVYYCGSTVTFGRLHGTEYFTDGHADHLTLTFTPTEANIAHSSVDGAVIKFIRLYKSYPNADGTRSMRVGKWKLEKGNKGSDWSPAPEDGGQALAARTYAGLIGSANNAASASFYFAKVHPTNYAVQWKVSIRIYVMAPEAYMQSVDIQLGGYGSSFSSYNAYTIRNSSLGMYYVNLYRATQAGINTNKKGHALGIGLRSSTNPTNADYARTIRVELLGYENCSVDFLDEAVLYADLDGTGSTNYSALTEMNVSVNGQNATNNTNTNYQQHGNAVKAGANGVRSYSLIMKDTDSTWSSLFGSAYNGTAVGKTVCETGFLLGPVLYSSGAPSGGTYAPGANTSTVYDGYPFDFRYSSNCASTLSTYRPVYLVGEMHDDGLLYLDETWWTQTVPTEEDGKTYVYVGEAYSSYQVWLSVENKAYQFYDGAFITYEAAQDARARAAAENVRTYAESLISQKSDEIELSITTVTGTLANDIQDVRDSISETADGISGDMQELEQRVSDQEEALLDYRHEASTYFRFNTDGLNIGKQEDGDESPYAINIDNQKMAFMQNGQEVAYVQYNKMHINAIEAMDRLSVGAAADGGYFDFISTEYGMGIKWRAVTSGS